MLEQLGSRGATTLNVGVCHILPPKSRELFLSYGMGKVGFFVKEPFFPGKVNLGDTVRLRGVHFFLLHSKRLACHFSLEKALIVLFRLGDSSELCPLFANV